MNAPRASLVRRLGSMLYEGIVLFSLVLVGFWIPQSILLAVGVQLPGRLLLLHIFCLLMLHSLWFWLNGGQTLAMKTWKLRLIGETNRLRPLQALLRFLAAWPCILFGGIGIFWALLDRDGQFLHDRIAGTRLIDAD